MSGQLNDWALPDYQEYKASRHRIRQFERGGRDLPIMLDYQREGKIDSWAVRWCYWQSKYDMLTVYPRLSLVQNIGYDGSGTHGSNEEVFGNSNTEKKEKEYDFQDMEINKKITKEFYEIYSATLWFRIKKKLRKIFRRRGQL